MLERFMIPGQSGHQHFDDIQSFKDLATALPSNITLLLCTLLLVPRWPACQGIVFPALSRSAVRRNHFAGQGLK